LIPGSCLQFVKHGGRERVAGEEVHEDLPEKSQELTEEFAEESRGNGELAGMARMGTGKSEAN